MDSFWKRCSTCKKEIGFNAPYQVCSVSTCRAHATNYVFCSVPCWDGHIPIERHRGSDIYASEKRSPRKEEAIKEGEAERKRIIVSSPAASDDEILVVISKVKKYIADKSGMNTSAGVYDSLTDRIKRICDQAIEEARRQGRKTVMDRDVP